MFEKISEEAFKEAQGVSYSRLSALANGPQAYRAYIAGDKESPAMALGSVIDIMLTEPDNFKKKVYVMGENPPSSEAMKAYVEQMLIDGNKDTAYIQSGYKISQEQVEKKFEKEGKPYYEAIIAAKDRITIGVDDMMKANQLVSSVVNHPKIGYLFNKELRDKDIEIDYQVKLIWEFETTSLLDGKQITKTAKSVIDILEINHNTKEITPWEFKTGGEGFMKSYRRYKRYLQGGMYYDGLIESRLFLSDVYFVVPTKFIYVDTNLIYPPVIFRMSETELNVARDGVPYMTYRGSFYDQMKIKGYKQLAAELDWHEKNDLWDYSYDVYTNNYEIEIDSFSIKL